MKLKLLGICLIGLLFLSGCGVKKVAISSVGNEMRYDRTKFTVKPGQKVVLILKNMATSSVMKHNLVILDRNADIDSIGQQSLLVKGYIPDDPMVLFYTDLSLPGQTVELTFTAPDIQGDYPYICTYPGHYQMMQGVMTVQK